MICPAVKCNKEVAWDDRFKRWFHVDQTCSAACWKRSQQ